jgi:hypothetical protein
VPLGQSDLAFRKTGGDCLGGEAGTAVALLSFKLCQANVFPLLVRLTFV